METLKHKIEGCLVGGAVGDALGYTVEFASLDNIRTTFGESGITRYTLNRNGKAEISDDTQMTLFTANGLLFGITRGYTRGIMGNPVNYISQAYVEWLETQDGHIRPDTFHSCWIRDIKELNANRAPGTTCLKAVAKLRKQEEVDNNSKGCGGVMRVAPIALFAASQNQLRGLGWSLEDVDSLGGEVAELTHKHPLGFLPAALLTHLVYELVISENITIAFFKQTLKEAFQYLQKIYGEFYTDIRYLQDLIDQAVELVDSGLEDTEAISRIGEGWVGEETLAIAIYCSLKYMDDFEKAIIASVNHSGDSDSTGSVTGNIMGAIVGYDAIPSHYTEQLELRELILSIADDLYSGCIISEFGTVDTPEKKQWEQRYVDIQPCGLHDMKLTFNAFNYQIERLHQVKNRIPVYSAYWAKTQLSIGQRLDYYFFDGNCTIHDCLSPWYIHPLKISGQVYQCVGHYIIAEKARLFSDEKLRHKILQESDFQLLTQLSTQVQNFEAYVWEKYQYIIALNGNYIKFSQNSDFAKVLSDTGNAVLIQTGTNDTVWGIGMEKDDLDAKDPFYWKGTNLYGFALMQVRDLLT